MLGGGPVKYFIVFVLWCILLVLCWPVAILAVVLYPLVWLLLVPFRIVKIAVEAGLAFLKVALFLPARMLGGRQAG
jgi:hypothetical protein